MKAKTMKLFSFLVTLVFISQSFVLVFFIYRAVSLDQRDNQLQLQIQNISRTNAETQSTVNYLQKTINGSHIQVQSKPAAAISSGQEDISVLVQNVQKGVVTIKTDYAEGSGFFITSDGYVVTNAHVLENGNYADVYTFDGKRHDSTLIGYDLNMDIAVLKIDGTYQALTLGNSDNVKVGERAVALGNPYGLSFSVTEAGSTFSEPKLTINSPPVNESLSTEIDPELTLIFPQRGAKPPLWVAFQSTEVPVVSSIKVSPFCVAAVCSVVVFALSVDEPPQDASNKSAGSAKNNFLMV